MQTKDKPLRKQRLYEIYRAVRSRLTDKPKHLEYAIKHYMLNANYEAAAKIARRIGIGKEIRLWIEADKLEKAVEIAYENFGIDRVIKICQNEGQGMYAAEFAEEHGHLFHALELYKSQNVSSKVYRAVSRLSAKLGIPPEPKRLRRPKAEPLIFGQEQQNLYIESPQQ